MQDRWGLEEFLWLLLGIPFTIFTYFLGFISGFLARASLSSYQRHNAREQRLAAADGKLRNEGKKRKIIALIIALVVVSAVIVFDHFKGPLFPDVLYSPK
jgi:hypothetical protein